MGAFPVAFRPPSLCAGGHGGHLKYEITHIQISPSHGLEGVS